MLKVHKASKIFASSGTVGIFDNFFGDIGEICPILGHSMTGILSIHGAPSKNCASTTLEGGLKLPNRLLRFGRVAGAVLDPMLIAWAQEGKA